MANDMPQVQQANQQLHALPAGGDRDVAAAMQFLLAQGLLANGQTAKQAMAAYVYGGEVKLNASAEQKAEVVNGLQEPHILLDQKAKEVVIAILS